MLVGVLRARVLSLLVARCPSLDPSGLTMRMTFLGEAARKERNVRRRRNVFRKRRPIGKVGPVDLALGTLVIIVLIVLLLQLS